VLEGYMLYPEVVILTDKISQRKSTRIFKSKVLAKLKRSEEKIQLNELHRKQESIES
jgi:phage gp16-like protein